MDFADMISRMGRVYAAAEVLREMDISKFPLKIVNSQKLFLAVFDANADMTPAEQNNCIITAIDNLAKVHDHARKWAKRTGRDPQGPGDVYAGSEDLKVIYDLHNNDKHGYPPRNGKGDSGLAPKLGKVTRSLELKTRPVKNSWVTVTIGPGGLQAHGDGQASISLDAPVLDKQDLLLGNVSDYIGRGIEAWTTYFSSQDIKV